MKKWMLLALLCLTALLTACGRDAPLEETANLPPALAPGQEALVCRVVWEEEGNLLLAKADGRAGDVYAVSVQGKKVLFEDPARTEIQAGDLVEVVYSGAIQETYPAQPADVTALWVRAEGFDDRCALYLEALEDVMEEDGALAHDIIQLGLDVSATALPPAEQSALALVLEQETGLPVLEGTWQELADRGYIDGENLYWEDGLFLSITEEEGTAEDAVTFDVQSWRSGLGALFLCDCTAARSPDGHWSDYEVGAVAVS